MSHPTITDIFAGIHAQTQAAGRELGSSSYIDYLKLYIANLYRPAYVSAYIYMNLILLNIRLFIFLTMLGDSFLTWLAINYP